MSHRGMERIKMLRLNRLMLVAGILGPVQFTAVYLMEGATRPGYDPILQPVSALSLTDLGWVNGLSILVLGLMLMLFALGLWNAFGGERPPLAAWCMCVAALGFVVAGLFTTDPANGYPPGTPEGPAVVTTLHGHIHYYNAVPTFGCLMLSRLAFARYFRAHAVWGGWALYSMATAVALLACFLGFAVSSAHDGPAGLIERITFTLAFSWMMLLAIRLLRGGAAWPLLASPAAPEVGIVHDLQARS